MQAQPAIRSATRVRPIGVAAIELGLACCLLLGMAPALALDDKEFCVSAQQLAIAAEKDVGVWIDRVTRNAGMVVSCDRKTVQFTRFTYSPSRLHERRLESEQSRRLERGPLQQPDLERSHRQRLEDRPRARPPPTADK